MFHPSSPRSLARHCKLTLKFVASLGLSLVVAGCGSSPASGAGEKTDHAAEAFGEWTCGQVPQDVGDNRSYLTGFYFDSGDPYYDHSPACSHVFIADGWLLNSGTSHYAYATYEGPIASPSNYGCDAMWAAVSLWEKEGSVWLKIGDSAPAYGSQYGDQCEPPTATINVPDYAEYKVMGQAGLIYSYVPVRVGAVSTNIH